MALLGVILATIAALAAFGIHGGWVFLIGLGLLAASEKKNPGIDFAESLAGLLFLGVVGSTVINFLFRIFN